MKSQSVVHRASWVLAAAMVVTAIPGNAQRPVPPLPPSKRFSPKPTPIVEARQAILEAARKARPAVSLPPTTPAEIAALARALQNDPDLIYQYVHDNIQFTPLWGYLKGPVGTLLDGQGDAFDQSALMVALLNQAALSNSSISNVGYEFGELYLTSAQLQSWLGVDSNPDSINGLLSAGGIPSQGADALGNDVVAHVWVRVSINGTAYAFDPAFKQRTWKPGIVANLPGIMGYTQAQFVADGSGTVTSTSIQGVNRTALRNDLNGYASSLAGYIRANLPTGGVNDIIGGGTIVAAPFSNGQTVRQTTNPNETDQFGAPTQLDSIPSNYHATLSISFPGAAIQTYNSSDIYGHRLSLFLNSSLAPVLYLDGIQQSVGTASFSGNAILVTETMSLPFAAFASKTVNQYVEVESNAFGGSAGYVFSVGWGQVGRNMVEKHRTLLAQARAGGAASNSEAVLGETLLVMGYMYLSECAAQEAISDQLLGTTTQLFYSGGITGEVVGRGVTSPYVDLSLTYSNTPARLNPDAAGAANSQAAYLDGSGAGSSLESTVLEQTQFPVPGFTAASTIKMLDISLENNDTIFDINNDGVSQAYYTSTIRPLMAPYYAQSDLATIDFYVNTYGERIIAPMHGNIAVGQWIGVGFKSLSNQYGYGEVISGGLNGGAGGTDDQASSLVPNTQNGMTVPSNSPNVNPYGPPGGNGPVGGDPVDIRKGSFRHQHDDLTTGPSPFPYGLTFSRSYDSNAESTTGPLGNGWTHNFAITATLGSDGYAGMGGSTPLSAVSSIVALYVGADLVKGLAVQGQANLQQFVLETVVNHWFTDYLTKNAVYVNRGWSNEEFTLLPDGTYAPQAGTAAILDAPGGTFRYRSKLGETLSFNSSGQISLWTNAAGASVAYSYSGGLLSTVANAATGRQLTLGYTGNLVSSVSDGTRTVSYSHTNGNLTTYTDALLQNTTYAYDTSGQQDTAGHLTQIFYPSHPANAFVTNYYDPVGRVVLQADANGNRTQAFFAGSRSEMDDALGNRHVWYIDPLGDITSEIQDYGPAPHLNVSTVSTYDAQLNMLSTTKPEGNSTAYTYDSLFNRLRITDTPKPGSPLTPRVTVLTYTAPVASSPNFEKVQTTTDPNGNVLAFNYDTNTGNLLKTTQSAVTKPGVGSSTPQTSFTYTSIGLRQSWQDAEGRVTQFQYDATHADQVTRATVDSGRLNLTTQYGYDSFGDVNSVTDANGHTTTAIFDALRRLLVVTAPITGINTSYTYFPDGQVQTMTRNASVPETTQYTYTLFDQVNVQTDPLGTTATTTYDADNRKQTVTTQVTASQNRQTTYSYDALGRLSQIADTTAGTPGTVLESHTYAPNSNQLTFTDASAHTTVFAYDGFDRPAQATFPDNTAQKLQYDPNGNVLQITTRSGQNITLTYDALNRTSTRTPAGESSGQVTYGYDFTGLILQASDQSSATPYQIGYDTAGRPTNFTDQEGRNTQVELDAVGNRIRLQWPANSNGANAYYVTYSFDALNRMTEIDASGSTAAPLAKYQWDALSRPALVTFGDGTSDSYAQYDASDNLLALTDSFTGGSNVTFSYGWQKNHQRQSTAVSNIAFQYTPATGTASYTADVDNAYASVGATTFTYDGNHNLTYDGFNTLTYDVENRLTQAQNALSGISQYLYDPLGHRKQKVVNGVTTQFVLAGADEVADYSGAGAGTAQTLYVRGAGGSVIAAIAPATGAVVYCHRDWLGSTVALTQSGTSGAAETYTYSEFGTPSGGSSATYSFAGYRYDVETGLFYLRARSYSPQLGRFLQTDPIGFAGGRNLYAYADNDPINRTDPNGTSDTPNDDGSPKLAFFYALGHGGTSVDAQTPGHGSQNTQDLSTPEPGPSYWEGVHLGLMRTNNPAPPSTPPQQ